MIVHVTADGLRDRAKTLHKIDRATAIDRKAVKTLLAEESDIKIVGEAPNFGEVISKASMLKPDVLLLDLHMPDDRSLERAHIKTQLELLRSQVKIIGMSLCDNDEETRTLARV